MCYSVYKESQNYRKRIATFVNKEAALDFLAFMNYEMVDENGFVWDLYYQEEEE